MHFLKSDLELGAKFDGKNIKMGKMQKDPKFIKIVEEVIIYIFNDYK